VIKIEFIIPKDINELSELPILKSNDYSVGVFDQKTIGFLEELSQLLLKDKEINRYPEIVALGFWLRKSNIERLKSENQYLLKTSSYKLSPRGKVFHICPSNVDTMFVYSLVVSLLVGNKNLLRLSSKTEEPQIVKIFTHIEYLIETKYQKLASYINIVKYARDEEINKNLSLRVNARVIWGGDKTINTFKMIPTPPRSKDIVFPDRLSLMILKSNKITSLNSSELKKFVQLFKNDSYTFNQLGCSSPQVVIFLGTDSDSKKAINIIVKNLTQKLTEEGFDSSSIASLKFNKMIDDSINNVLTKKTGNNVVTFIEFDDMNSIHKLRSCGGGYFYEKKLQNLSEIQRFNHKKLQTITYFGLSNNELKQLTEFSFGEGIDRVVPLGKALEFDYLWDGYNLFEELSRKVALK
jgi:hypothetical protein